MEMARPGDAHFLGVLSAHPGEPGRESCLWSVGVAGAQAHISPPVGLELSRLSGWGQELVAKCESGIEAKDPLRQNNRQNAKPNSRQKIPKPRPNGVKARSRGHASAPRSHSPGTLCPPGLCLPWDAAPHFLSGGEPGSSRPHREAHNAQGTPALPPSPDRG